LSNLQKNGNITPMPREFGLQGIVFAADGRPDGSPLSSVESQPRYDLVLRERTPLTDKQLEQHDEVIKSLDSWAMKRGQELLIPPSEIWQPSDPDLLPDPGNPEEMRRFQEMALEVPDGVLIVIAGNYVTEEAITSDQAWLNRVTAVKDHTGVDPSGWGFWTRGWSAEENRHGIVQRPWLVYSKRYNMRKVDESSHSLVANGFDPMLSADGYEAIGYVSLQEALTKDAHGRVGKILRYIGGSGEEGEKFAKPFTKPASDESRHETFYSEAGRELAHNDAEGFTPAVWRMLKRKFAMPGALMDDKGTYRPGQRDTDLFRNYSLEAHASGIITARDIGNEIYKKIKFWGLDKVLLSGEAARAQEELCSLPQQYTSTYERIAERAIKRSPDHKFSWLNGRIVSLTNPRITFADTKQVRSQV